MSRKKQSPLPPYFKWRDGRPRWEPGPALRAANFHGRDLKDDAGRWLGLEAAIATARELNAEVATWRAGGTPRRRRAPPRPTRSCQALYDMWVAAPVFTGNAESTRKDYAKKAKVFLAAFGPEPVAALDTGTLYGFWERLHAERGHHMANGVLAVARAMLSYARRKGWIVTNPAFDLDLATPAPRVAFWSSAKVAALVATADAMGEPAIGDAVFIALHSAQRQGDVLTMSPRIFTDRIRLTAHKTKALVDAPLTPQLAARIAGIRERWKAQNVLARETMVAHPRTGKPYKGDYFRALFGEVRAEAVQRHPELATAERMQPALADLRFQDLRDTAVTRLAMSDCTLPQIAAISNHTPEHITNVIKHYLALNEAIADQAIAKLVAWLDHNRIAI